MTALVEGREQRAKGEGRRRHIKIVPEPAKPPGAAKRMALVEF